MQLLLQGNERYLQDKFSECSTNFRHCDTTQRRNSTRLRRFCVARIHGCRQSWCSMGASDICLSYGLPETLQRRIRLRAWSTQWLC